MLASTFSRVTPEPSAFAVKSSSCSGPPTSCENASFVPSGDHATSHTSARPGTSTPRPPPSGCTTLIAPMLAGPEANAILLPSGDQLGYAAFPDSAPVSWRKPEPSAFTR